MNTHTHPRCWLSWLCRCSRSRRRTGGHPGAWSGQAWCCEGPNQIWKEDCQLNLALITGLGISSVRDMDICTLLSYTRGQCLLSMLVVATWIIAKCNDATSSNKGQGEFTAGLRLKLAAIDQGVTWRMLQLTRVWPPKDADDSWPPRPQLTW